MTLSPKQLAEVVVGSADKGTKATEIVQWLIKHLAEEQALDKMTEVLRAIDDVWKDRYGAANITVETAYPISEELRKVLNSIAKGASVNEKVDESLIGGAKLRIDDKIIDGTISGTLNSLKQRLTA